MRWIFWIFVALSLSLIAHAEVYKSETSVVVQRPCYYNNTFCDSTTGCNLTVFDSNNTAIINNQPMAYQGSYFSYDLGVLNKTGDYVASMTCTSHGLNGFDDFTFSVNKNGIGQTSYNVTIYIVAIFGVLIFMFLMVYFSNKINFNTNSLWVVTITSFLRTFLINIAFVGGYVILSFIRFIVQSQEIGTEYILKIFDYIMMGYMYLLVIIFIAMIFINLITFFENKKIFQALIEEQEFEREREYDY